MKLYSLRPISLRSNYLAPLRKTKVRSIPTNVPGDQVVRLEQQPRWRQRDWRRQGTRYSGWFVSNKGSYQGVIEKRGDIFKVFIRNPPPSAFRHWHSDCLQAQGKGWYQLHLAKQPRDKDVNAVIAYVEDKYLRECHALER